jgi:hypothetical protein
MFTGNPVIRRHPVFSIEAGNDMNQVFIIFYWFTDWLKRKQIDGDDDDND